MKIIKELDQEGPQQVVDVDERLLGVCVDNAVRAHATRAAQLARASWLQAALSSTTEAVVGADATSRVTFMNRAAETLTGWQGATDRRSCSRGATRGSRSTAMDRSRNCCRCTRRGSARSGCRRSCCAPAFSAISSSRGYLFREVFSPAFSRPSR